MVLSKEFAANTMEENKVKEKANQLNDIWSFWYSPRGKKIVNNEDYFENLKFLGNVHNLEEFFSYYCFMKRPSEIPVDNKVLFFRKSCKPLWENWKDGGCWIIQFKKNGAEELLNKTWELLLFVCLSEELEEPNKDINLIGVVLSVRAKRNILEIWLREAHNVEKRIATGEKLRVALDLLPQNLTFYFKENSKSLKEKSTLRGAEGYKFVSTPLETPMSTPGTTGKDIVIDSSAKIDKIEI